MEKPDPDLPRGMLRIAKRGDSLEISTSGAIPVDISATIRPTGFLSEQELIKDGSEQPRRGVLRINASELVATPGVQSSLRYPRPQSPVRRGVLSRGSRSGPTGGPRVRHSTPDRSSPISSRSDVVGTPRGDFVRPIRIASNVSRPIAPTTTAISQGSSTPDGKPSGPVFASDFATQEIFRALEQAKPTTIPKPPIPELTDEQKTDPDTLREFYLTQLRMLVKDSQVLRDFSMSKPVKLVDSYFFWCLRKGPQLEHLIQAVSPRNANYQVVGVMGFQETGKSYILSQIVGLKEGGPVFGSFTSPPDPMKPYGKFRTEGIDCYISREQRTIFLDVQAVYSASVLEEMIIGDRKPPVVSSEHVFVEHTVELQSIMFGAFLMSVCHKIIIVTKGCVDKRILRFLRLATILKLGPVHKDTLSEANLFDHWPQLIFVNNFCNAEDLYRERIEIARERLASLLKDYPLRYNDDSEKTQFHIFQKQQGAGNAAPGDSVKLFLVPDAEMIAKDEYLRAEFFNQLTLLKMAIVGSLPKESVTPGMPMTEKEWFRYARRCWAAVCKAPLVNSIAKELNVSNSV